MMKKIVFGITLLAIVALAFSASADPFAPATLKITAPSSIKYNFDNTTFTLPVTVTGSDCGAYFSVFTKGKAATIPKTVNGYLGWHEVNKIDTCMYISPRQAFTKGSNNVVWNGKGEGGAAVPKDEYTYYIWAVDDVNLRVQVTKQISFGPWNFRTIVTKNVDGTDKAQPVWYHGTGAGTAATTEAARVQQKWIIGSDPLDVTMRETCSVMLITDKGGASRDPKNEAKFWTQTQRNNGFIEIKKWTWVPNGVGMQDAADLKWGTDGKFQYACQHNPNSIWGWGTVNDRVDKMWVSNADAYSPDKTVSEIIELDLTEGVETKRMDLAEWWVDLADGKAGAQNVGGPSEMAFDLVNKTAILGSHSTCVNQCINPYAEDAASLSRWVNGNGDYVGDHNWEEASTRKWVCNDYVPGDYKYNVTQDRNGFAAFPCFGSGAKSFGLYTPDGTGMYIALAGETAYQKFGIEFIDYDSAYDGLYTSSNVGRTTAGVDATVWYVGMDSIKGTITDKVGVDEAAPAAFSVAQNTPNPFNPTTTINFTLAKAGLTTVEVFNVAGQKVDTLLNANMSAGSHSVTWNAQKFSAGVYFGTVRTGSLTRTIKMTLLK